MGCIGSWLQLICTACVLRLLLGEWASGHPMHTEACMEVPPLPSPSERTRTELAGWQGSLGFDVAGKLNFTC